MGVGGSFCRVKGISLKPFYEEKLSFGYWVWVAVRLITLTNYGFLGRPWPPLEAVSAGFKKPNSLISLTKRIKEGCT